MPNLTAISVQGLTFRYGDRLALREIDFSVVTTELFGLLGPNGGGKTTLFRILSTLLPVQEGTASVLGLDVATRPDEVRFLIGVTFQSPSLDLKLTVRENLIHQSHLYGLSSRSMRRRINRQLDRLGLADRASDRVESLSGGLKRRVEIAKGLLHDPQVLLLDEPSSGLDLNARHDLWRYLQQLQSEGRVTILVTTHLMEEAERCDRLGILDEGRLVALGNPDQLKASVNGDCITIHCQQPAELLNRISERFGVDVRQIGDSLRIERTRGHEFVNELIEAFPDDVTSLSVGKPTLEDVFVDRTGHRFWDGVSE